MLFSQLQTDLSTSLKGGKADRVETIRFLIAAIANAGAAKYGAAWESEIKDTDVTDAVKKQIKTHRESIEAFEKAGRKDLRPPPRAILNMNPATKRTREN